MSNIVSFPTRNLYIGDACIIVKKMLDSETVGYDTKIVAIEKVARMETHNCITKDELVFALRWIFDHFDFRGD